MWDLKPDAPEEIRGLFKPISTNVTGIQISEHLPKLAQQTDKLCIIRSMTSPEAAHERGTHYMMTGYQPLPGLLSLDMVLLSPNSKNSGVHCRPILLYRPQSLMGAGDF